jgi:hypothetical protein
MLPNKKKNARQQYRPGKTEVRPEDVIEKPRDTVVRVIPGVNKPRADLVRGDRIVIKSGLWSGSEAEIVELRNGGSLGVALPTALVRIADGRTRTVRTVDLGKAAVA